MIKPIKIAILSCNHGHAKGYYALKDDPFFELVAVSIKPDYRDRVFAERLGNVPIYDNNEDLYRNHPDLEAVIIGSDNRSHITEFREAIARDLHIFSMKVPTFDLSEYDEMISLSESRGVVCQVELEMRERAEIYRVKELIEQGSLGKLLSISMTNYSHNPVWWRPWQCSPEDSFGKRVPLRPGDARFRGGALADHPHVFDVIRVITGASFDSVYADVAPNLRPVETEDMIRLIGKLSDGTLFSIDPSYANDEHHVDKMIDWIKYPRPVEVTMNLVGTEGTLVANVYERSIYLQGGARGEYMASEVENVGAWNKRMHDFYRSVRHGEPVTVGLREHRETILAMLAAYESVSRSRPVKLSELH